MASLVKTLLPSLAIAGLAQAVPAQDTAPQFPFENLALQYLAEHGHEGATPDAVTFEDVLDGEHYARVALGALDLRYPVAYFKDPKQAKVFIEVVQALLDAQRNWISWRDNDRSGFAQAEADLEMIQKWVRNWSHRALAKVEGGDAGTLYDQLKTPEPVLEAAERLREFMRPEPETAELIGDINVLVFAPDREHFLQLMSFAGWLDDFNRKRLWHDKHLHHSAFWYERIQVVAMEYAQFPVDMGKPYLAVPMNDKDKTGQVQYMVERAAGTLLRNYYWRYGVQFFESALLTNLVIDTVGRHTLGEGEWALEWRTSGARTEAYERFVPGGNPGGGTLPARKAGPGAMTGSATETSRWQETAGSDHFVQPLLVAQKEGAKLAKKDKGPLADDQVAHFELHSAETSEKTYITAPFFGRFAEKKELPSFEYLDDYEDFFRCYRSCFVDWLRTHGVEGSEGESLASFSQVVTNQANRRADQKLYETIEEVYGTFLSAEDGSIPNLEWRFLTWLSKQKVHR